MTFSIRYVHLLARMTLLSVGLLLLANCVGAPTTRLGMVKDNRTGLMIGSRISNSIVTDASLFENKRLKVRIRNTSGDAVFDLNGFQRQIENAFAELGYEPTSNDDFAILVNVNVRYSGQIQTNMETEYGFLGASAGGIAGYNSSNAAGTAAGVVAGATLGSIIGSFVTDDTYIIVTEVAVSQIKESKSKKPAKTITFSRSPEPYKEDDDDEKRRWLKNTSRAQVAVFAGGRNTAQSEISGAVRERIARIVGNII